MPIYEYECSQCGALEEVIQKFSDEPLSTCKRCSGKLTKLMSHSSFHLKGSGWYVTDYANKSSSFKDPKKENPSETKAKSDSGDSNKTPNAPKKEVS